MILLLGIVLVDCETFVSLSIVGVSLDQFSFLAPPKP
jgi:hypothetical protein